MSLAPAHARPVRQALSLYRGRGQWDGTLGSARSCLAQAHFVWTPDLCAFVRGLIAASTITAKKLALLTHFADGHVGACWDFAAGTVSWAKKNVLIIEVSHAPARYQITDAGRAALAESAENGHLFENKDGPQ